MSSIFLKEINAFFSSLIGYIVIGVFLATTGLVLFVFPDTSLLNVNYASLGPLFELAPMVFLFLIPAVTMRSLSEEYQTGTIELLATRPIGNWEIVGGKFLASFALVGFALLPTLLYYYTMYQLGSPAGNIDSGAVAGSYIGLFFLGGAYVSIGIFASSLSNNQIVAFVLATFLCFFLYYGFDFLSRMPVFVGRLDDAVQMFGIDYHYRSISRGLIDTRDMVYFLSVIALFLALALLSVERRKW